MLNDVVVSKSSQSMSVDLQEFCQEAGLEDCMYGGLGYDAVWAISLALNETNSSGDLATALASSAFNGVSVSSQKASYEHQHHLNDSLCLHFVLL